MTRLAHAWRALQREQRAPAFAALGLFASMFLPWYSKTFFERGSAKTAQASLSAFQAFSFVEAAVLLVSAGILAMLFARAERRSFQLPGGDGLIVMIAGGWAAVLIFYRLIDKPTLHGNQQITTTVGVEWGIFIALLVALGLAYSGARLRAVERGEVLVGAGGSRDRHGTRQDPAQGTAAEPQRAARAPYGEGASTVLPPRERRQPARRPEPSTTAGAERSRGDANRPRYPPAPAEQMSFEDTPGDAPAR